MTRPRINKIGSKRKLYEVDDSEQLRFTDAKKYHESVFASEKQQEELRALAEDIKREKQRNIAAKAWKSQQNEDFDDYDWELDSSCYQTQTKAARKAERFNELWERQSSMIKDWFCEAFSFGNPDPKLSTPHCIEPMECIVESSSLKLLLDNEVMNLITTQLIGENNQYYPRPTEWINGKKSDVLYATDDSNASPPVLIEVQNVADDAFLHRVVGYCGKVYEEHGAVPVVLVVVVKKIRDTIMRKATKDTTHPFLFKLPCFPWAKKCFFISTESIRDHLTEIPLSPLVALGAYFTSQKTSILDHSQGHDPTIQMLYNLSQRIFENIAVNENTTVDDLLSLCQKSEVKIKEGIKALEESTETSANKRAVDCLNDGLEIVKSYRLKYMPNELSPASLPVSASSPVPASSPELEPSSRNWEFVHNYIQSLGDERMNWNACFVECQRQDVLSNYTKPSSLKSAYQRWKKQQT